jgi:hypothetical protein
MQQEKVCNKCNASLPETSDYFSFFTNRGKGGTTVGLRGTCKKCMAKRTAEHSKNNPELVEARAARRREVEAQAVGTFSSVDIAFIRRKLNDQCRYCGVLLEGRGDVDHMLSLSKGGTNWPSNLTLACKTCNLDKHSKSAEEFLNWRQERGLPVRIFNLEIPEISVKRKFVRKSHQ